MSKLGVAVKLWSEEARPLLRTAASLAETMKTTWVAIVVTDSAHQFSRLTEEEQRQVRDNTNLITWLGGTPFFCQGENVAKTITAASKLAAIDILVLGRPKRRGLVSLLLSDRVSTDVLNHETNLLLMFTAYPRGHESGG